jgi:hypothetical protein
MAAATGDVITIGDMTHYSAAIGDMTHYQRLPAGHQGNDELGLLEIEG